MGHRILIVDDSAVTRAVLKKTIHMTDIPTEEIIEANNGLEALEVLDKQKIDLIFADLNMPRMNGVEMTERIFANEKTSRIPIVVISTEASTTRIDQLQTKGVQKYIHKPFTPEMIKNVLQDVLEACST